MVNKIFLILPLCFSSFLFLKEQEKEKMVYEDSFHVSSSFAAYHSLFILEEDEREAMFDKETFQKNFKYCWEQIESRVPSRIYVSLYAHDSFIEEEKRGVAIEVGVEIKGNYGTYIFRTRYQIKERNIGYEKRN